jgi:hypothetical protein
MKLRVPCAHDGAQPPEELALAELDGWQWPAPSHDPPAQGVPSGLFGYSHTSSTQAPGRSEHRGGVSQVPPHGTPPVLLVVLLALLAVALLVLLVVELLALLVVELLALLVVAPLVLLVVELLVLLVVAPLVLLAVAPLVLLVVAPPVLLVVAPPVLLVVAPLVLLVVAPPALLVVAPPAPPVLLVLLVVAPPVAPPSTGRSWIPTISAHDPPNTVTTAASASTPRASPELRLIGTSLSRRGRPPWASLAGSRHPSRAWRAGP